MEYKLPKFLESLDPNQYLSDNYLVLDVETTNLEFGTAVNPDNRLLLACWYSPKFGFRYKWGGEFEQKALIKDIESVDFIICHNSIFELGWLKRSGMKLENIFHYCTQIGEYVRRGNRNWIRLSLDESAKRYKVGTKLSWVSNLIKSGVPTEDIPKQSLLEYCLIDVDVTHKVFLKQREVLKKRGLLPTQYTRCIFTPVLADIEFNGLFVDKERVLEEHKVIQGEYIELEREIDEFTGGINPNSSDQVAEFLYKTLKFKEVRNARGRVIRGKASKKWPDGKPKTDGDTLDQLVATTKKQKQFLELKKAQSNLNAKLTKTLTPLFRCVEETEDHVLYASFRQTVTKTHRLSSSGRKYGVQFQNFDNKYKKLFSSRHEGWNLRECDYSKLEFNVAAFLTQDPVAINDVLTDFDVHKYSAAVMKYGMEAAMDNLDNVTKEERRLAKKNTFGPLFGKIQGTEEEVIYFVAFKEKYKIIAQTQDAWVDEALHTKQVRLITGLITYFPYVKITKSGYINDNTKVRNLPIQGFATAEIVPVGVTHLWHRMKANNTESYIVNTVHDSSITEEKPEEKELLDEIEKQAMIEDVYVYLDKVYGINYNIPLEIETESNKHWGSE